MRDNALTRDSYCVQPSVPPPLQTWSRSAVEESFCFLQVAHSEAFGEGGMKRHHKRLELTKRPSGTHKRTKLEHKFQEVRTGRVFRFIPWVDGARRG